LPILLEAKITLAMDLTVTPFPKRGPDEDDDNEDDDCQSFHASIAGRTMERME
jgi:hypothetical protein